VQDELHTSQDYVQYIVRRQQYHWVAPTWLYWGAPCVRARLPVPLQSVPHHYLPALLPAPPHPMQEPAAKLVMDIRAKQAAWDKEHQAIDAGAGGGGIHASGAGGAKKAALRKLGPRPELTL
jgi:hypothetical protein